MDLTELKSKRTRLKRSFTRSHQKICRYVSEEENLEVIDQELKELKRIFANCEEVCNEYSDNLDKDNEIESAEKYFKELHDDYIKLLKDIKDYKLSLTVDEKQIKSEPQSRKIIMNYYIF